MIKLDSSLWIDKDNKGFLGKVRIELLKQIDKHGSLSRAAKAMKMSYKAAWDSLNEMKELSDEELIISNSGGKGGGGSKLTQKAHNYIIIYELLFKTQQDFLKSIDSYKKKTRFSKNKKFPGELNELSKQIRSFMKYHSSMV